MIQLTLDLNTMTYQITTTKEYTIRLFLSPQM